MKRHIVCLGDSNTHGYCADPRDSADGSDRYDESQRWTCLLQQALGEAYLVIEEGLAGRTAVFHDPIEEGMCALDYVTPCLMSHRPVDLLIVMLGSNDLKSCYAATPLRIARGMERLIRKARATPCWGGPEPNILLICPAPIDSRLEASGVGEIMGPGCAQKSRSLSPVYAQSARDVGCHFLDAAPYVTYNQVDYMHFTPQDHRRLAQALAQLIPDWM